MSPSPSRADLVIAPEALTLEILDAALVAAETAMLIVYPDLDTLGETYGGCTPPASALLAALLVPRLVELRGLLAWYRTIYQPAAAPADDCPF
jgi:hypothetical protein